MDIKEFQFKPNQNYYEIPKKDLFFRTLRRGEELRIITNFDTGLFTVCITPFEIYGSIKVTRSQELLRRVWHFGNKLIFKIS
jgi:hypothetical protein